MADPLLVLGLGLVEAAASSVSAAFVLALEPVLADADGDVEFPGSEAEGDSEAAD